MLESAEIERISDELMDLRRSGRQIAPLSSRYAGFTLNDAYQVVARIRDLRIELGENPVGRKIGFTNRSIWQTQGIEAPIWNYVYDRTVADIEQSGASFVLRGNPEPRIEPEVVLHLCAAPQQGISIWDLVECIDWVAPGFEVVNSVFPGWHFAAADAAAAFGVHNALFIGRHLSVTRDKSQLVDRLSSFEVSLESSNNHRREGSGSNVLGGPIEALKFLVAELSRFPMCEPLQAGEVVTTGTLTEAMPLSAGQTWDATFRGIDFQPIRLVAI